MPKTFIVAEAGINANSDMETANKMICAAAEAGADAIKFQLWKRGRFPDLERYRFKFNEMAKIKQIAEEVGLKWFCTPFDFESIDFLAELGMDIWKVPSGMVTNRKYLEKVKSIKPKQIFLSTGMASLTEIAKAICIIVHPEEAETAPYSWIASNNDNITILHCVTGYPVPVDEINLGAMAFLKTFRKSFGLSDHTLGIEIPIAAVAMEASVIEKHFTLDRNMPGPDQKMSLEPGELKAMVKAIRNVELALSGDGIKKPTPSEMIHRDAIRERMKL